MRNGIAVLGGCFLFMAGCGNGNRPAVTTGVLQAGGVTGVAYSTPTQSGITDANGTFRYVTGETVSFSIGRVELGSTAGAEKVSLFTLAGIAAPASEPALRAALEIMSAKPTAFSRAVNITRFLMALDADGNPANGIDANNREAALAGVSLDFDLSFTEFGRALDRKVPDITRNIPLWVPVAQLFRMSGVRIPVHAITRIQTTSEYSPLPVFTQSKSYDVVGNLAAEGSDIDGDGLDDLHYRYNYDALGRVLSGIGENGQNSFFQPRYSLTRYTYDAQGNQQSIFQESDDEADGRIDSRGNFESVFDRFGNNVSGTRRYDSDGDGDIDQVETVATTFDARSLGESSVQSVDNNGDGIADSRATAAATYDPQGRMLSNAYEFDGNLDGVADSRWAFHYEYSGTGRAQRTVQEYEEDFGAIRQRYVFTYEFDMANDLVRSASEFDDDGDGIIDSRQSVTFTHRVDGRLLGTVRLPDYDGDGVTESPTEETYLYDAAGTRRTVVRRTVYTGYVTGPGVRIGIPTTRTEYGADGELLSSARGFDFDGDLIPERVESRTTVTHALVADGVLLLAREFMVGGGVTAQFF